MGTAALRESARPATRADVETLAALATEALTEQQDTRGGWVWSRREARSRPFAVSLETALADPDQQVWAGEVDDVVVGYCVAGVEVLATGDLLGVVHDVFVTPAAREVAVGERLVEAVLEWCEERGCVGVDALALPGNRATKNFFESFGFKARLLTVHRPLRAQGPAGRPGPDSAKLS